MELQVRKVTKVPPRAGGGVAALGASGFRDRSSWLQGLNSYQYYIGLYGGYIGIMEKKMESFFLRFGHCQSRFQGPLKYMFVPDPIP